MAIAIRQLHKHFVGEVSGLDLRKPLTRQEAIEIEAGMDKYAVLIFRGQDITDEQQLAFALNFGEREKARGGTVAKKEDFRAQRRLQPRQGRQAAAEGSPHPSVQSRQLPLALR
jgi:alpha-ketoglutarate-dependent 2,4-dichlorophenoxyacetate dioxygenase